MTFEKRKNNDIRVKVGVQFGINKRQSDVFICPVRV